MSLFWSERKRDISATFIPEDILPPLHFTEQKYQKDIAFWNAFSVKQNIKQTNSINSVMFSPAYPHVLSVGYGVKVQNYHPSSNHPINTISKFKDTVRCVNYRADGELMIVGDDSGRIRLFETAHRNMLKMYKGHKGPVHSTNFRPNQQQIVSCSDDKTCVVWDLNSTEPLLTLRGHTDLVRACTPTNSAENWVTGSYDNTIKLWDLRTKKNVASFEHGAPVEDLVSFPRGDLVASVGGTVMKVWDILTGKLVASVSKHSKTIMKIALTESYIVTAGLDRNIKIYDQNYNVFHAITYSDPIISLAISVNNTTHLF